MPSSRSRIDPSKIRSEVADEAQYEAIRQRLRAKARTDLWFFAYHCCGFQDIDTPLHHTMCDTWVERRPLRSTLWMVPRGHLKTSLWTVAANLQEVLINPDIQIMIGGGDDKKAAGILADLKKVVRNSQVFRWLFPEYCWDLYPDSGCRVTMERIDFPCSKWVGSKQGSIMVGSPESDRTGMHFDLLHYDDIVHEKNSLSKLMLDNMWTWWRNQTPLQKSPKHTRWRYVGTPWHYLDISWRTVKEEEAHRKQQEREGKDVVPRWHLFRLSVWHRDKDGNYITDENGQRIPIWPEWFPNDEIETIREKMGRFLFAAQYEVDPMPAEDAIFNVEQIRRLDDDIYVPEGCHNFMAVDLSMGEDALGGDYMVATCASFDHRRRMYVREIQRTRDQSVLDFVDTIWRMVCRWRPQAVGVEITAFQHAVYRHYQTVSAERGYNIPWMEIRRTGQRSKVQRIRALQPRVERGDFYIVGTLPEYDALETEMRFFPRPPHDDILDTLADLEEMAWGAPEEEEPYAPPPRDSAEEILMWADGGDRRSSVNPILRW